MHLVGSVGQIARDVLYDASGTVTSANTPQLILPEHRSRCFLQIENISSSASAYFEIGAGTATATISGGAVTSVTVKNPGFNYTIAPIIEFFGGGSECNSTFLGCGQPGYGSPGTSPFGYGASDAAGNHPAAAIAILSGGAIQSIQITDPGAGYVTAPYVLIRNSPNDPFGCANPGYNSGSGIYLVSAGSVTYNGTFCPTAPVAVYSTTTGAAFTVKWSP